MLDVFVYFALQTKKLTTTFLNASPSIRACLRPYARTKLEHKTYVRVSHAHKALQTKSYALTLTSGEHQVV